MGQPEADMPAGTERLALIALLLMDVGGIEHEGAGHGGAVVASEMRLVARQVQTQAVLSDLQESREGRVSPSRCESDG